MRKWIGCLLALLVMAGLHSPAWGNSELHTGGRLFFPLWDVSTENRLTFIIVTRQALRDGSAIQNVPKATIIAGVPTILTNIYQINGNPGKCLPRGNIGSVTNVNRTDLGGTTASPVFVDDVHFEYYGRTCIGADEIVHMSCADTDLFILANPDNSSVKPRIAFNAVAGDGRGALDVHLVTNGSTEPKRRKLENSLMGEALITDLAEGWVAGYAAAAAKAMGCSRCEEIDGGTTVGYENYPMEVYLPFALADPFVLLGKSGRNVLSLWGPGLLPGANLSTSINLDFKWWDGRERPFLGSVGAHSMVRPLGGATIAGLDSPLDSSRFNVANFVCGHAAVGQAENDGFPRIGTDAAACGAPDVPDIAHPSDNFESTSDITTSGHSIQSSTPMGWWRFTLRRDGLPPTPLASSDVFDFDAVHSGRGLVGVVLSSPVFSVDATPGVAYATRLWHEDPCEVAQSGATVGPPHKNDRLRGSFQNDGALFNVLTFDRQLGMCPTVKIKLRSIVLPPN